MGTVGNGICVPALKFGITSASETSVSPPSLSIALVAAITDRSRVALCEQVTAHHG